MYQLEEKIWFWLLLIIPVMVVVFLWTLLWKRRVQKKFGNTNTLKRLSPDQSAFKSVLKLCVLSLSVGCFVMALVNPKIGTKLETIKREGVDIVFAIDVSKSMLAEDVAPNRLEKSKRAISKLVERLHSDRIGIVVFAGEAYTQLPLTSDLSAAKLFLRTVSTDIVPTQGTNIGAAIKRCVKSFDEQSAAGKAIIIITDGENHEEDAVEEANVAAENGIQIYTVGMATTNGVPIPLYQNGRKMGYRKDKEGNSVVTMLNESMLKELAAEGNGFYIRATNSDAGLNQILDELEQLKNRNQDEKIT